MRACPGCISTDQTGLASINYALFDDLNLAGEVVVCQCRQCGMVYNNSSLTEDDYNRYYQKNEYYFTSVTPGSGGSSIEEQQRYQAIYSLLRKHCAGLDSATILDFGCGKGGFLKWISQEKQNKVLGIEASKHCRMFLNEHSNIPCYGSIENLKDDVDIIILSHVLEHLYDPLSVLKQVRHHCLDTTTIYIEVPLAQQYLTEPVTWQQLYFEHINHFYQASLKTILAKAGFKIEYEDVSPFSPDAASAPLSIRCLARQGDMSDNKVAIKPVTIVNNQPCAILIKDALEQAGTISIWGISQYTQLLLGCYPQLFTRLKYLFDSSSSKIGRRIGGKEVIDSKNIGQLQANDILLIAKGAYLAEMMTFLNDIGFIGKVITF